MIKPLFLAHGSPMMAIEENDYTKFLNTLGNNLVPKAIVIFTSHWDSKLLTISAKNDLLLLVKPFFLLINEDSSMNKSIASIIVENFTPL